MINPEIIDLLKKRIEDYQRGNGDEPYHSSIIDRLFEHWLILQVSSVLSGNDKTLEYYIKQMNLYLDISELTQGDKPADTVKKKVAISEWYNNLNNPPR